MEIIGREKEIDTLSQLVSSKEPSFIALYGRRRVGKTYLIRQFFNNQFTFYTTGLANANTAQQLIHFTEEINNQFNTVHATASNWLAAFKILILELKKKKGKKIIFIDELPWLDTKKSDFMTGLEYFWNAWASAHIHLKLIVCGSAASWMINNLIKNKAGLHNRVTCRMPIVPFTLAEVEAYVKSKHIILDRYQLVQLYMVFGGVPYYWSFVQKGRSANQIINELCFTKNALLQTEFVFIFSSLFNNANSYEQIITALFQLGGRASRTELIKVVNNNSGGSLSKKLQELELSGFISTMKTYGTKGGKNIYVLSDFYTLFYLKFIQGAKKTNNVNYWAKMQTTPKISAWQGLAFEQVCFVHLLQIQNALKISGISTETNSWLQKGTAKKPGVQIDMIIDRKDRVINICEIKFTQDPFTITKSYDMQLRQKIAQFKNAFHPTKAIHLVMISMNGLTKNAYSGSLVQRVINGNDLF